MTEADPARSASFLAARRAAGAGRGGDVGSEAELAERIADAVRGVPGVVGLHGGVFGEVATYLPGRRVSGIRITPERAEVHLTLVWGEPVRATAEIVRDLVAGLTGVPVFVTVEDVVTKEIS